MVENVDVPCPVVLVVLTLVSGLSFLYYGSGVLSRTELKDEFERYGLPGFRRLVGLLEILGGTAVMLGLAFAPLGAVAAAGLTTMMALGLIVRLRIHDPPRLMVPAASLGALNAVLVVLFLTQ
ncbi:MAG: DoxX family protein [Acidimicrobiales bacterium]|nr:DoxX family protein [Acidimicrobiales bacterium]